MSAAKPQIDPALKQWATERAAFFIDRINEVGSLRKVAAEEKVARSTIQSVIAATRRKAEKHGYSPEHNMVDPVPPGFKLARHSQYYDRDGVARGRWVIATPDQEQREALLQAAVAALRAEITPLPTIAAPGSTVDELLNVYTFTDYHFNMLAWGEETGDDWDMAIAAETLRKAFRAMVDRSPPASTCVVAQLGDFGHTDSFRNATPTSGHELDADSRYPKAVRAMLYALRDLIEYAASKHKKVIALLAEGNHDLSSSVHFRETFAMFYENNPRIEVFTDPLPYYVYEFGKNMLCWHHGHLTKKNSLPLLFATDFAPIWGRTVHRVIHTGHLHHRDVTEHPGIEVYQHPTLAASDAFAARGGWRSKRRAIGLTYHVEHGETDSVTITPDMLK